MKDLSCVIDGETLYLPTWYLYRSDKEIEETKRFLIEQSAHTNPVTVVDDYDVDIKKQEEIEAHIVRQLKKKGFTRKQVDEILARYYSGQTLDSAMQSILI